MAERVYVLFLWWRRKVGDFLFITIPNWSLDCGLESLIDNLLGLLTLLILVMNMVLNTVDVLIKVVWDLRKVGVVIIDNFELENL